MMLYITYNDLKHAEFIGVWKKVVAQADAMEKGTEKVYYTFWSRSSRMAFLMYREDVIEKKPVVTREAYKNILIEWIEKYEVSRTYIRYSFANWFFLDFLKYQKEQGIKTVLEIPTYPYDDELPYGRVKLEDIYYRNEISSYVGMISTYSKHKEIWGIPCINLSNGIDMAGIPLAKIKEKDYIEMIAVAAMAPWHGYERVIRGLYEYYSMGGEVNIHFKLIGDGKEIDLYKRLCEEYHLQSHIEFCGVMKGEALNKHFDMADLAISVLGLYKKGLDEACPIKSAEYCARGIPMVLGYNDTQFPSDLKFILQVPNDDSSIDIAAVVEFYKSVHTYESYQKEMRDYAEKNLDWENIMRPVMEYLKGDR